MDSKFFYIHILLLCVFGSNFASADKPRKIVTSYKGIYGDNIDCVSIYDQPAFDHPLLRSHQIQVRPPRELLPKNAHCTIKRYYSGTERNKCPNGSIPIIVPRKDSDNEGETNEHLTYPAGYIEYATVATPKEENISYYGVGARLDVLHPRVAQSGEYSMAKVSIVSGYNTSHHTSIEAGWIVSEVNTNHFTPTRFFIRWTTDNYTVTGCFNLECSGFVHTNPAIVIGGAVSDQRGMVLMILKDPASGNWWLYKNCEAVGYWPAPLFETLSQGGEQVFYGGEVLNKGKYERHTETQMGSGIYGDDNKSKLGGFIGVLQLKEEDSYDNQLINLENYEIYVNKPACYNAAVRKMLKGLFDFPKATTGPKKYKKMGIGMEYGGPGYSPRHLCT